MTVGPGNEHAGTGRHAGRLRHTPDAVAVCWALPAEKTWAALFLTLPVLLLTISALPITEGLIERIYPYRYLIDTGSALALTLPWDARSW